MVHKAKKIRDKGKLRLSQYFKKIEDNANVAIIKDSGVASSFPDRIQGLSGKVIRSRGKFKDVLIKDGNKAKTFIIHPVHLKLL